MLKTLHKSLREYKVSSILTPLLMVGEAAMEIVIPFLMTYLIKEIKNIGSEGGIHIGRVVLFACLMVAAAMFALLCGLFGARLSAKASCGFAHNLR